MSSTPHIKTGLLLLTCLYPSGGATYRPAVTGDIRPIFSGETDWHEAVLSYDNAAALPAQLTETLA